MSPPHTPLSPPHAPCRPLIHPCRPPHAPLLPPHTPLSNTPMPPYCPLRRHEDLMNMYKTETGDEKLKIIAMLQVRPIQPHTHALTHSHTHTLTLTRSHSHTHRFALTRTHSHSHAYTLTDSHSHTNTLTHSHTHTLTHSHSHTHSRSLKHTSALSDRPQISTTKSARISRRCVRGVFRPRGEAKCLAAPAAAHIQPPTHPQRPSHAHTSHRGVGRIRREHCQARQLAGAPSPLSMPLPQLSPSPTPFPHHAAGVPGPSPQARPALPMTRSSHTHLDIATRQNAPRVPWRP